MWNTANNEKEAMEMCQKLWGEGHFVLVRHAWHGCWYVEWQERKTDRPFGTYGHGE